MGKLDGLAVVITGAGRGLGAAYARDAAREGARVIVNDVVAETAEQVTSEIVESGGEAIAVCADITSWDAADELISRCVQAYGSIDGLVNNAGIERIGLPEDLTEDDFRASFDVNVMGTAFCGTLAARRMLGQGSGCIINVTSGTQAGMHRQAAYSATKGAIASLTYTWAMDLGDRGVRVNAFAPMAATAIATGSDLYEHGHQSFQLPTPDDNAPVVTFLLSAAAAGINGQVVRFDCGRLSLMTHPAVLHPPLERESWTVDDVDAAFRDQLAERQQSLGVVALAAEQREYRLPYE